MQTHDHPRPATASGPAIERILVAFDGLMHQLTTSHAPDFLGTPMTMAQAKVLYLVQAAGRIRMSELAARLGVTVSTASGAVDRLVEAGLLGRADDPADRRQVVITMTRAGTETLDRMRELNSHQMQLLLGEIAPSDLPTVERAIGIIAAAAARIAERATPHPTDADRKDPT